MHHSVVYDIQFTMQQQCNRQAVCQRSCNVTKATDYTPQGDTSPRQTLQICCKSSYLHFVHHSKYFVDLFLYEELYTDNARAFTLFSHFFFCFTCYFRYISQHYLIVCFIQMLILIFLIMWLLKLISSKKTSLHTHTHTHTHTKLLSIILCTYILHIHKFENLVIFCI